MSALSVFLDTPTAIPGEDGKLRAAFGMDRQPGKVFLWGDEYLGEDGECFVHPVIRKVALQVVNDPTMTTSYLPPLGLSEFTRSATELALGKGSPAIVQNRTGGVQTLGGIGAIRVGAELLKHWYNEGGSRPWVVYVPAQCDDAVVSTLQETKIKDIHSYPYWDPERRCLAFEEMLQFLESVPEQSIIVLYTSAHCPTGADPTLDQWKQIADVMMRHRLFPFFLLPSQGLCSGDPNEDAASLRYFVSVGFELICAQSFSQNFGLYNERVGNLILVLKDSPTFLSVQSQAEKVVQTLWFRPPCWGARLVTIILNNPALVVEWKEGLRAIAERTMLMREMLKEKLRMLSIPGSWDHLSQQSGLYCCTGLRDDEVEFLVRRQHVYLPSSGNINISTLNHQIVDYVAETMYLAVTKEDLLHKPSTIHL
ncbi:putative aspartate aminotransferase, cytoplasmic 2 [Erpetoichthys calabaricus]|uniref:putative aspartate aminotransferase, cytoplasmic 2 n=1 Tax=Erpetoichthys calabaricus TaxID=27687 RepID=UPI00109EEA2D|nr:putative aspartate aminotransferase, cytoplasmic 2 [Erpetoichthys calabaricus]